MRTTWLVLFLFAFLCLLGLGIVYQVSTGDSDAPPGQHSPAPAAVGLPDEPPVDVGRRLRQHASPSRYITITSVAGDPLEGAQAVSIDGETIGRSGKDGVLSLAVRGQVVVIADGYLPRVLDVSSSQSGEVGRVALDPDVEFWVTVADPWGHLLESVVIETRLRRDKGPHEQLMVGECAYSRLAPDAPLLISHQSAKSRADGPTVFKGLGVGDYLVEASLPGYVQAWASDNGDVYLPLPFSVRQESGRMELHVTMRPILVGAICAPVKEGEDPRYAEQFFSVGWGGPRGCTVLSGYAPEHEAAIRAVSERLRDYGIMGGERVLCIVATERFNLTDDVTEKVAINRPGLDSVEEIVRYARVADWKADMCTMIDLGELPEPHRINVEAPCEPYLYRVETKAVFGPVAGADGLYQFLVPQGEYLALPGGGAFASGMETKELRVEGVADETHHLTWPVATMDIELGSTLSDCLFITVTEGSTRARLDARQRPRRVVVSPATYRIEVLGADLRPVRVVDVAVAIGDKKSVIIE